MKYVIAVDIGGTNIRIGVVDEGYELSRFRKLPREEIMKSAKPEADLLDFIREYMASNCEDIEISAVAAGSPSTLDRERRTVLSTPNIPNFDYVPLADTLSDGLGIPVFTERDVSMIFQRDMVFNRLPENAIIIACYVGTGIGNVIFIDGKMITGKDGAAGEIGHIPMLGKTDVCGCGNTGCVECFAGGKRLELIAETHFPGLWIKEIFQKHPDHPAVREYIDNIAVAITAEINILNPDMIILGGGVLAMWDFPRDYLEQCIRMHARKPFPAQSLEFIYSEEADENGVIGGGIYAHKKLKESVK